MNKESPSTIERDSITRVSAVFFKGSDCGVKL